jgi:hypothetical protein
MQQRFYVGHLQNGPTVATFLEGSLEVALASRHLSRTSRGERGPFPDVVVDREPALLGWDSQLVSLWYISPSEGSVSADLYADVFQQVCSDLRIAAARFRPADPSQQEVDTLEGLSSKRLFEILQRAIADTLGRYGERCVIHALGNECSWHFWASSVNTVEPNITLYEAIADRAVEIFRPLLGSIISPARWASQIPLSKEARAEVDLRTSIALRPHRVLPADEEAAAWLFAWVETAASGIFLAAAKAWAEMISAHPLLVDLQVAYQKAKRLSPERLPLGCELAKKEGVEAFCRKIQEVALFLVSETSRTPLFCISNSTVLAWKED